jgi:tetratricopeptide (TPR) repeat protein
LRQLSDIAETRRAVLNNLFKRPSDGLYRAERTCDDEPVVRPCRLALVISVVVCIGGRAAAQAQSDDEGRSRAHYDAGRALFVLGSYQEALREFTAGYQLSARPKFLLNIAQCYRRLGELERAKKMLEQYLQRGAPTPAERADIEQIMAELDREIANRPAASPRPAAAPTFVQASRPMAAPSAATPAVAAPAPPPKRSFMHRHWWIIPVSLVVAGGLAVGIYFAARPSVDCGSLGCVP